MTRTYADAFLEDVLARPDDDAPRLIFADWLEEHGGPPERARAEFIRVQCRLADPALKGDERRRVEAAQDLLAHEHGAGWDRALFDLVEVRKYHRGFVGEVWLKEEAFLAGADRLFRLAPVQHLHLGGWHIPDPRSRNLGVPALAACPHLARLRGLDLSYSQLSSNGVQALLVSEHLTGLTALNLACNAIGDAGARALAGSPLLARLTTLDLSSNAIGAAGVRLLAAALGRLAASDDGLRLRTLRLAGNRLSGGAKHLVRSSPLLRRVVRLDGGVTL
jgi:uncharacterized protein (TIGR02996 family)